MTGRPFEGAPGGDAAWAWGVGLAVGAGYRDWPVMLGVDMGFSYFNTVRGDDMRRREKVFLGNLFLRVLPITRTVRPYLEGVVGFKRVSTEHVYGALLADSDQSNSTETDSVGASSLGVGTGVEVLLSTNPLVYLTVSARWLYGSDAAYTRRTLRGNDLYTERAAYSTTTVIVALGLAVQF